MRNLLQININITITCNAASNTSTQAPRQGALIRAHYPLGPMHRGRTDLDVILVIPSIAVENCQKTHKCNLDWTKQLHTICSTGGNLSGMQPQMLTSKKLSLLVGYRHSGRWTRFSSRPQDQILYAVLGTGKDMYIYDWRSLSAAIMGNRR